MAKSLARSAFIVLGVMFICSGARLIACAQVTHSDSTQAAPGAVPQTPAPKPGATVAANRQINFAPLTADAKMKRSFKEAFFSPWPYVFTAIGAAISEAGERHQPQKTGSDRFADGLSRFAISFTTNSANTLLGDGIYPIIFKQDPRYHPSLKKGFAKRTVYAASRVFVTYSDRGRLEPNYSFLGGSLTASALANAYERNTPGRRRIGVSPTFTRFGSFVGFQMLENVCLKEFWPEIKKRLGRK